MRPAPRRRLLGWAPALLAPSWWLGWPARAGAVTPAEQAPRVTWPARLPLLEGGELRPADLSGRAVVVVFFATDCAYCVRHMAHLRKLIDSVRGEPLTVLGVAHDRSPVAVREHLQRHGLTLPVTLEQAALHAALSPRRTIPLTCVIDRAGRLREVIPGEMFEDDVLQLARWARDDRA